jgi:acyl carrier protein
MHQAGVATIDNVSRPSILTATATVLERRAPAGVSMPISAFHERIPMSDSNARSLEERIAGVVQRLLAEHSIDHVVQPDEDLRQAGLSSLDMVSLVLSIEEEFELMVPEVSIMPSNFRSIAAISRLVESLQRKP